MKSTEPRPLIVITGPTATGKTRLAARVAKATDGEVISADSRQVYRGMDLGTGKDFDDYVVDGYLVPYHLVDIAEPGTEYNVYEFQQDFLKAYHHIVSRNKQPVLCGGTGLYIEAAISGYKLIKVPVNPRLRKELENLTMEELTHLLASMRSLHNTTDITERNRLLRAVEIETYYHENPNLQTRYPSLRPVLFGIHFEREALRQRITQRLKTRLESGMLDEINELLNSGLKPGQLTFYGLEYRFLTRYATGEISYDEMFEKLNTAIHQFAKRQMTWFRRMERNGFAIHWIDGNLSLEDKARRVLENFNISKRI